MTKYKPPLVIDVSVYHLQVAVYRSDKERRKTMKALGLKGYDLRGCNASAHKDYDDSGTAWFSMVLPDGVGRHIWAHECVHIADYIMEHVGIPCNAENTEARAYLVGYLFSELERLIG